MAGLDFVAKLTLGGAEREIKISFNRLCAAESVLGIPLLMGIDSWANARLLRALVWAGLQMYAEDGSVVPGGPTILQVGDWIQEAGPSSVLEAVVTAWLASMPDPEPETEEAQADGNPPEASR